MSNKKSTKKSTVQRRTLRLEGLERRELMAGNVFAQRDSNGTLNIGGDAQANGVQVRQISANQWRVDGLSHEGSSTRINNSLNSALFTGVRALNVNMNAGNDRVEIGSSNTALRTSQLPNGIRVVTGTGNDQVAVNRVGTYLGVSIDTGAGNDTVQVKSSNFGSLGDEFRQGELNILTGGGSDTIDVTSSNVVGSAYINPGVGNFANSVNIHDSFFSSNLMIDTQELDYFRNEGTLTTNIRGGGVEGRLTVDTRNTRARTTIASISADSLYARMGEKNDSVTMNDVAVQRGEVDGGAGLDSLFRTRVTGLRAVGFEITTPPKKFG